jgi:uncharacterized protein YjbI with pentapeptide repeats
MDVKEIIKQYSSGKRNFSGVNLAYSDLRNASLKEINLESASLKEANLNEADLTDANLTKINLESADLRNANLQGANLTNAVLTGASLRGANLTNAIMKGANLELADLREAIAPNLQGALQSAKLKLTKITKQTLNSPAQSNTPKSESSPTNPQNTSKKTEVLKTPTVKLPIPVIETGNNPEIKLEEVKPKPISPEIELPEQKTDDNISNPEME